MTLHVFTYGTLRPGGALDDIMPGRHVGQALLPGLLYRHHGARFPVFVESSAHHGTPTVLGDLFSFDDDHLYSLDGIIDMECGAGYDVRFRQVVRVDDADIIPALVFTWPERQGVGPRIFSGDWLSPEARNIAGHLPADAGFTERTYR